MPILQRLQNHFPSYVWKRVLSMLVGLMLLKETKTLTALQYQQSVPTLSRTPNLYPWPLEELIILCRSRITGALKKRRRKRGRPPFLYLIVDDAVVPKRGKKLPAQGFYFSPVRIGWCAVGIGSSPRRGSDR